MSTILTSRAARRETRARFWDVIAENSDRLVQIYSRMLDGSVGPVDRFRRARYLERHAECVNARDNALAKASRIRSGLE